MFWCNSGDSASVQTAQLDGSNRQRLTVDKVYRPGVLAVDLPVKRIYVYDTHLNSLQFCTYDGRDCHQVVAVAQVSAAAAAALSF